MDSSDQKDDQGTWFDQGKEKSRWQTTAEKNKIIHFCSHLGALLLTALVAFGGLAVSPFIHPVYAAFFEPVFTSPIFMPLSESLNCAGGSGTWQSFTSTNSGLASNYLSYFAINEDSNGNMWFTTWGGGVSRLSTACEWSTYNTVNSGLAHNRVYQVTFDAVGNRWFATENGLSVWATDGTWTTFNATDGGAAGNMLLSLAIDEQGNKWVAVSTTTAGVGVAELKADGTWQIYTMANSGLISNHVLPIVIDSENNKWFGTDAGVTKLAANGTWTSYTPSISGFIGGIVIDRDNNKWFVGEGGVRELRTDGTWIEYTTSNSGLVHNSVRGVAQDREGNMWFGTWGGGVSELKTDRTWVTYSTANSGITTNLIVHIKVDGFNNKWFTHECSPGGGCGAGVSVLWGAPNQPPTGMDYPPVTTARVSPSPNAQGIYPGPVTVNLAATASTGFTVAATYYMIDGGATQSYSDPFVVSGDGTHVIEYWSVDNGGVTEAHETLTLPIASLRITTESPLPSGPVGTAYSTQLEVAGGTPPYRWGIAVGALPSGLNLGEFTGVISGTPSTAGTFGFTIVVTDSTAVSVTKQFGLAPPPPSGNAGLGYTLPIHIDPPPSSGGSDSGTCSNYSVVAGTLPAGLTLNPNTGVVSGTPINGGTYNFTIGCTVSGGQNAGQTATKDFTVTIYNPAPTITSLDPKVTTAGGVTFNLVVNGTNFVSASTIQWNGMNRTTTYVSATQLKVAIMAADIAAVGTANVTVVNPAPGGGTSTPATFAIVSYAFTGFFSPVDNPVVVNVAKAGSAIPVKFSLGGDQGLAILVAGYPASQKIMCDTAASVSTIEQTVTAGSSSLTYDATSSQYIYVWKTDKAWAGTCRQLIVRLADGSDHKANFQFK